MNLQGSGANLQTGGGGISLGVAPPAYSQGSGQQIQTGTNVMQYPNISQPSSGAPSSPIGYNTGGAGSAGTGSPTMDPQVLGGLYDQQIGYLQNYANNAVPQYQNLDQNIVNQGYDTQKTNLDAQHQLGVANLGLSQKQLDNQHTNSLRDLGTQLRGMYNSYNNQIGVMGAGDSSAAPLLSYALQQQGNTNLQDLNNQYNLQESGINLQGQGLETNYQGQVKSLDNWKNTNLQQIAENYSKQLDQLNQQIMGAQGDKARFLSLYGTQALAQQALSQMQALNHQYTSAVDGLHQSFSQLQTPSTDISKYTGGYNVQPFSQQQLQGLNLNANTPDNSNAVSALPVSLNKLPDQNLSVMP